MSDQEGTRKPRDGLRPTDATDGSTPDPTTASTATATDETVNAENYTPAPGEEPSDLVPIENWVHWPSGGDTEYDDRVPIYTVDRPSDEGTKDGEGEAASKESGGTKTET